MTRCDNCGYFIDNTIALGGCYCDPPKKVLYNIHEIESIQPIDLIDGSPTGNRLYYQNTVEPYYPYATQAYYQNLACWVNSYIHHDREFKIWFKGGYVKTMSYNELADIMKKDNFEEADIL